MEKLEDAGLLSTDAEEESGPASATDRSPNVTTVTTTNEKKGSTWFEGMIEGSELGRLKRRRGGQRSSDGRSYVEWEIREFESEEGDGENAGIGKRKLSSLDKDADTDMRQ